ncbi:MAG: nitrate- and nitrite sensing domain-containing protein, partial [Cytophagaceae bacterium]
MNFLKNLNIRAKLLLLLTLLFIPLLYFVQESVRTELQQLNRIRTVIQQAEDVEQLGVLINELQKERALSHGYIGSKGQMFLQDLQRQRSVVDNLLQRLSLEKISSAQSLSYFNQLPDHRQNVHNLSLEDLQIEQYYTHLIKSLISDIS